MGISQHLIMELADMQKLKPFRQQIFKSIFPHFGNIKTIKSKNNNIFENERTIKSKSNGSGTAQGNLVFIILRKDMRHKKSLQAYKFLFHKYPGLS